MDAHWQAKVAKKNLALVRAQVIKGYNHYMFSMMLLCVVSLGN